MEIKQIEEYAKLIVKMGVRPQKGQEVMIMAGLDQIEFVRMVAEMCYQEGASKVHVDWQDMPLAKLDQIYQSEERLSAVEDWVLAKWQWRTEQLPAYLWLDSDDPDGMDGIDQGKRARAQMAKLTKIKPFRDAMENKFQWCIAGVPGVKWANKVFPALPDDEAVEKLWDAILTASRAKGDAVANWQQHNQRVHDLTAKLNKYNFASLEYKSANGTDFKVGLMPQGVFAGAEETDLSGRKFNPNIPSEEIFTTPEKGKAEGLLVATKPLSWQGTLIEDFSIRFENGKAVEVKAAKGQEALERMIAMDENACYLGECALIDYDSPINQMDILFYSTLYDENASCHMALGRGFDVCVKDYEKYSHDELKALGVNDSIIHVDFMIGSEDLAITGVTPAGERIPIFKNGRWAI